MPTEKPLVVGPGSYQGCENIGVLCNPSHETKSSFLFCTMCLIAAMMIFFLLVIGFIGFLPMYFLGFDTASHAVHLVHDEAFDSFLAVLNYSLIHLPDVINAFSSHYIPFKDGGKAFFPDDKDSLLFSIANVLSNNEYQNMIRYLSVSEITPFNDMWSVVAMTPAGNSADYIAGAVLYDESPTPMRKVNIDTMSFDVIPASLGVSDLGLLASVRQRDALYSDLFLKLNNFVIRGIPWSKQWSPKVFNCTSMYFSYVLPFNTTKGLGFWEATMWISELEKDAHIVLDKFMGNNGRFMLLDNNNKIVVLNNWKWQQVPSKKNDTFTKCLMLDDIDDHLMREMRDRLKNNKEFEKVLKKQNLYEFSFPYSGTVAYAKISCLTNLYGFNLAVWIVILESEMFHDVYMARTFVALANGLSVVIVATFAVCLAYIIVRPLQRLMPELERASNLQLRGENVDDDDDDDDDNDNCKGTGRQANKHAYSCITEIKNIQKSYAELVRQLRVLKTFVPEAILAAPKSRNFNGERLFNGNQFAALSPFFSKVNCPELKPPIEVEVVDHKNFATFREEMRLNVHVFKEEPNTFIRRYCTVVLIENINPFSLDVYFENVLNCASEQNGCVEYLRPDGILVSFAAHLPLPMHSIRGCRFAFELFARLTQQERETITILVDSNEFLVGTCGTQLRNARVVVGIMSLRELVKVARRLECRLAATAGTVSQLQDNQAFPVECVLLSSSAVPVVLYELRPPRSLSPPLTVTVSKHFRLGFAAMRQGLYEEAMKHYHRIGKSDPQAQRLFQLCAQRCKSKESKNYVRLATDILQASIPDIAIVASKALTIQETRGRIEANMKRKKTSKKSKRFSSTPLQHSKLKESSNGREDALFEMLTVSSSGFSGSSKLLGEGCSGADDVPLLLTDMNNKVWNRSLKKISEGAFSTVYLGMSEDGVQVAIKCIPRQRRDIMQESLEAEMNFASKLRHPNIVQYVSCSVVQSCLAIIMEYVPGGSLHTVINNFGRVSSLVARRFTVDILNGLNYLHGIGVVHCDVKPHNVLLGMDGVCKLSDFGSTILEATDMARTLADDVTLRGTALYMAPEVARGGRCTPQSDIFSLGISLLEMLSGRLPWRWSSAAPEGSDAASLHALFKHDLLFVQALARGHIEPDIPDTLDNEVTCFVRSCCHVDPAMRPSALSLLSYAFVL